MADQFAFQQRTPSAELLRVLADSLDAAQDDQNALRDAVCAYITGQKERDLTLEEIIETVRSILAKADSGLTTPTFGGFERIRAHAKELVNWCITHGQRRVNATS